MLKRIATIAATLVIGALSLSGCASMPGGYAGMSSDPMAMLIVDRSDDLPITSTQYIIIQTEAQHCGATIDKQLSSLGEAVLTDGVVGAVASGVGTATGAHGAFGASVSEYGKYAGDAAALPNAVNGAGKWSFARATATQQCVETHLRDKELDTGNPDYHDLHVYVSSGIRTRNRTNHPASGLVPDWSGAKAGS